jgi:putative spermidine/putrescine transport system permease protein
MVVGGGAGSTVLQSLGLMPVRGAAQLSFEAYAEQAPAMLRGLGVSLGIAAASTAIAAVVGTSIALLVVRGRRLARALTASIAGVIAVPHLIGAVAVGLLLSGSGVLARFFGVPAESWPDIVAGPLWLAVVFEYAWKESAFVALIVSGSLLSRAARFDETAILLGARPARRVLHVTLPLAAPSIAVTATVVFVYTLGSYEVAWRLGRPYPEPLSVLTLRLFTSTSLADRPGAAAVAVVTMLAALVVVGVAGLLFRRLAAWR